MRPHVHDHAASTDEAAATTQGMQVLLVSFAALAVTALVQASVVVRTGSSALLSDALHNFADALTAVPLAIAFALGRRPATRRYTYGFGRGEDLAGIAIIVVIAASAVAALYVAIQALVVPEPVTDLPMLAAAALIGCIANEWVARYRIRVGRRIGSATLVADGLHARTDALTSLAVLLGASGVALGVEATDPIVGLLIAVAIMVVLRQAAREVYRRLMDAVDPVLLAQAEDALRDVPGVLAVGEVRMRWIGHSLRAEAEVTVDRRLDIEAAHLITVESEHALLHAVPRLRAATVHADPDTASGGTHHLRDRH